jgi:hypothetical protein
MQDETACKNDPEVSRQSAAEEAPPVVEDYDPFKCPPDFDMARRHSQAMMVNNLTERFCTPETEFSTPNAFCPC